MVCFSGKINEMEKIVFHDKVYAVSQISYHARPLVRGGRLNEWCRKKKKCGRRQTPPTSGLSATLSRVALGMCS